VGRPESAGTPNRLSAKPVVSVAVDHELDRWLLEQANETGLSKAQVVRFHLERAMGTPEAAALLKQMVIGGYGDMRGRIAVALKKVRLVMADMMAVALAAEGEQVDSEVTRVMDEHLQKTSPRRGMPEWPEHGDESLPTPSRRPRRTRRGGAGKKS
jgi:hypothetical protein